MMKPACIQPTDCIAWLSKSMEVATNESLSPSALRFTDKSQQANRNPSRMHATARAGMTNDWKISSLCCARSGQCYGGLSCLCCSTKLSMGWSSSQVDRYPMYRASQRVVHQRKGNMGFAGSPKPTIKAVGLTASRNMYYQQHSHARGDSSGNKDELVLLREIPRREVLIDEQQRCGGGHSTIMIYRGRGWQQEVKQEEAGW